MRIKRLTNPFSRRQAIKGAFTLGVAAAYGKIHPASAQAGSGQLSCKTPENFSSLSSCVNGVGGLGQNPGNGAFTEEPWLNACTANFRILHSKLVRIGIDGVQGRTSGEAFTWTTRDYVVDKFLAAGYEIHAVIDPKYHIKSSPNWSNNWTYFCASVMSHYAGRIKYYIIGNELDNKGVSVADMISLTKIAYEQSRIVAPDGSIKIESCPAAHPERTWQRDLILGGVTRYCDVVGFHFYGGAIMDGKIISTAPAYIIQANSQNGYPIKPIANSENGCSSAWAPSGLDPRDWQGRWLRLNWVQNKRYGMSNIILYNFGRSTAGEAFDFGNWNNNVYTPYQAYNDIRDGYVLKGLTNAGFESVNDKFRGVWIVHWNVNSSTPPEPGRVSFITNDAANARTGSGYCKMTSGGVNRVRQVVSLLTPGQQYTIHAYAKGSGDTAYLKALGFNVLNGNQAMSQQIGVSSTYQLLQVSFTPSKDWVVISLESAGKGTVYWDDVSISN